MSDLKVRAQLTDLLARDRFAKGLGISLVEAGNGSSTVTMEVKVEHLNFMGWAHGGVIFSLADTAFGLASNSHDKASVGIDAHVAYLSGVREGNLIEACASEISRTRRKAMYRIDVHRPSDDIAIAAFTGTVYVTEQPLEFEG